jgi:DnaK suppressor protein
MDQEQRDHFRQKLRADRAQLTLELEAIPPLDDMEAGTSGDMADQASAETDRDLLALNRGRAHASLLQVERALVRIENGTFGICEDTGQPIEARRLEAQPTATLSIEAQEQRERDARLAQPGGV